MEVLIKEPGKKAQLKNIKNNLETLQEIVGGYIETVNFDKAVVICNEEGLLKGLPFNCEITREGVSAKFAGTIIICGIDGEDFTFTDFNSFGLYLRYYDVDLSIIRICDAGSSVSMNYEFELNDSKYEYDYDIFVTEDDIRAYLEVEGGSKQLTRVFKEVFDIGHLVDLLMDNQDFVDFLYERYYDKAYKEWGEE